MEKKIWVKILKFIVAKVKKGLDFFKHQKKKEGINILKDVSITIQWSFVINQYIIGHLKTFSFSLIERLTLLFLFLGD